MCIFFLSRLTDMLNVRLLLYSSALILYGCTCVTSEEECAFEVDPEDITVEVNHTNVTLNCTTRGTFDTSIWEIYLRNGTYWTVSSGDVTVHRNRGLEFVRTSRSLRILKVQAFHSGVYRCRGTRILGGNCTYYSENATVTVRGPATVEIFGGPMFSVNTTTRRLLINGSVDGQPDPNVTLSKFENGQEVVVSIDHPRITLNFMDTKFTITVMDVQVKDSGVYRIRAANEVGGNYADFRIMAKGPDPPNISVPKVVVTGVHQNVRISCTVQETASVGENSQFELKWTFQNGTTIPTIPSSVYMNFNSNFNVTLVITNFTFSEYHATCVASNIRNSSSVNTVIYVPPVPPKPTIKEDSRSGTYTISWLHSLTNVPVVMYVVNINQAGTDELVQSDNVSAYEGLINFQISNLPAGEYDVRLISVARVEDTVAMSIPSVVATFHVEAIQSVPVATIIGAVGGAMGVLILIVIGILGGAFFLCFYSHRRQMNSQQQQWSSEQDKVDSAVSNTYTALAINPGNSELPPSPSTPLVSSFFSTEVDPKWEFPRENIQLTDVLHEGQFTILYKGTIKGIKERTIEVAVKSVRDDANEDDVKALVSEMETLGGLGPHPNIVSLVRVCTVGNPMYVVMEYMCHGDLLGFLRASRGHHGMYHISPGTRYQPPTLNLCSRDLLNVATKIANGMRYLSDRKIVHRALCAKNVLVGPGMDIKIYNVGSFDISFETRDYFMKWKAPETLFDHTTTTYSDVWSYGITLWELVTVGGAPYADLLPEDLYSQLHSGMRMPKPHHCAQEVYNIMWQCWQRNPADRPHFAVIHDNLEELVESKISYLDLRQYNGYAYSQFDDAPQQLSTAL